MRLRRSVPSTPMMGSDSMNSGMFGERQTACSMAPSEEALMRALRESPAPLSTSGMGVAPSMPRHQSCTAAVEVDMLPTPARRKPMLRNTCWAITLLLCLLSERITSGTVGETDSASGALRTMSAGTLS